ncbi:hydroxyacid-oxoacid transhydrogenase [Halalkalicoccus sp. GCM10025322]|uniref:hydroxyacid-oxoacid transhydrogenase n=1 Tax=Halalkalicoccus TaxID=332246 RepID=UPI002F969722
MSYDRSVSADPHELQPETVWHLQMPQIRFGRDSIRELGFQLSDLGVEEGAHGLVVTDDVLSEIGHVDRVVDRLEKAGFAATVWDGAEREPSIENVEGCLSFVRDETEDGYDFYLGVDGGSCLDVAKTTRAVIANGGEILDYVAQPTGEGKALTESGPPLVLLPTTAGTGAEISPVAILSVEEKGVKEGISSNHVRADAAVLDPTLTTTLPAEITAKTAMDALGHAIEGYTTHPHDSLLRPSDPETRPVYAGRTELTEMFSEKAISLLSGNVRRAVHNGDDLEARSAMLKGALFGAIAGLTAGASLCHAMAYPVGNEYHTYHGETIAVLTPASTLGYNAASDPERFARIARILGANAEGLGTREAADRAREEYVRLQRDLNVVPSGLAELADVTESEVDELARRTVESQQRLLRVNPRPVTEEDVAEIYRDALYNWENE